MAHTQMLLVMIFLNVLHLGEIIRFLTTQQTSEAGSL